MISKAQIKFVQSLKQKKYREIHRCFIAEGSKLVRETAASRFLVRQIFASREWIRENAVSGAIATEEITSLEMERITGLSTPSPALAIVEIPETSPGTEAWKEDIVIVLDGIQDPGNLGTIIRIADWFGIRQLICSVGCVDLYNPKVVQSTMGSITRVNIDYLDLPAFLAPLNGKMPVFGMKLDGDDLYRTNTTTNGLIVIGSEAHGISDQVSAFITQKISIPFFPADREIHAESLNAAVAAGIVCAEFRRT